jgi:cardiolipin synthase (CMP-forming)
VGTRNFEVFEIATLCLLVAVTLASKITVARLLLVPFFGAFVIAYGWSISRGEPLEWQRWTAVSLFVAAAASDGLDGWVARRFNQISDFGAFIDPLADKALMLTAIATLSMVDWAPEGWRLPLWFAALVVARDCIILGGIRILHSAGRRVKIQPHWIGKVCTFTQMVAIGWVMLQIIPLSPVYPAAVAGFFTVWSAIIYIRQGWRILRIQPPLAH